MKKVVYYISGIFLGVLLSFIVHAGVEIFYINYFLSEEIVLQSTTTNHLCFLPFYLQLTILFAGIIGGYFFARWGWRIVYEKNKL